MAPRSRRNAVSHFNVMVVGSAGVGKTSFVKTLLAALKTEMPKEKRDSAVGPSESDICKDPTNGPLRKTLAPYTVSSSIQVDGDKVMLTVIDTPGFYDDYRVDKQLHDILGYIEHQFDLTLAEVSYYNVGRQDPGTEMLVAQKTDTKSLLYRKTRSNVILKHLIPKSMLVCTCLIPVNQLLVNTTFASSLNCQNVSMLFQLSAKLIILQQHNVVD